MIARIHAFLLCLLCLGFFGARQSAAAAMPDLLECGTAGNWITFTPQCYTACGYSTGSDACRASRQGLKDVLSGIAGISGCFDSDCTPESCNTQIECDTSDCSQVTTGQPFASTTTGLFCCATCWTGGQGRVRCTTCSHI